MNNEAETIHFIYYLKLGDKLTPDFIKLSEVLKKYEIQLIPIERRDLLKLSHRKELWIVSVNRSIATHKNLSLYFNRILNFSIMSGKVNFIELSSFSPLLKTNGVKRIDNYHHISLPVSVKEFALKLAQLYFNKQINNKSWPGRRAPRMSPLISGT